MSAFSNTVQPQYTLVFLTGVYYGRCLWDGFTINCVHSVFQFYVLNCFWMTLNVAQRNKLQALETQIILVSRIKSLLVLFLFMGFVNND